MPDSGCNRCGHADSKENNFFGNFKDDAYCIPIIAAGCEQICQAILQMDAQKGCWHGVRRARSALHFIPNRASSHSRLFMK